MISYKKLFHGLIWILFFSFFLLYFAQANGYYEDLNRKKTYLTQKNIEKFEQDVKKGKKIDVNNYVVNLRKNYNNKISSFGLFTSKVFAKSFKWGMNSVFNVIDKMMDE